MPAIHPRFRFSQYRPDRYTEIVESIGFGFRIGRCGTKGCKSAIRVKTCTRRSAQVSYEAWTLADGREMNSEVSRCASRSESYAETASGWVWFEKFEREARCACGGEVRFTAINGTHNPAVKCNAKCTGARGADCDCACGGKNHGGKWGG